MEKDQSSRRALVVDDDDSIRTMLAKIVERLDFRVDTARDGLEAMEKLDLDAYDVVLLDLMMPRVDGYAVLRYMQEKHKDTLACTIVASAVPESEVMRRFEAPVYRFHAKPFDIGALMHDIRACTSPAG